MFGKGRLTESAQALVTSSGNYWVPPGSSPGRYTVELRVQFPDGATVEMAQHVFGVVINTGDIVPVRYDPADRSKIEIDDSAMLVCQQADIDAGQARALEIGEAELRRANLVREISARTTPPTDGELQAVVNREHEVLEQQRAVIRRYAGSAPTDADLSELSRLTEAVHDARAELDALKALRPDWSPAG
jgi:hypothetical protein